MNVSIIVCTRNRADSLGPTLLSIGDAAVPAGWSAELIVIDNGSTDRTRAVAEAAQLTNVAFRYISEPTPGLARARNTGLNAAAGDVLLFTDDDVRVPRQWIEGMCRPLENGDADAVAGGVVFPADLDAELSRPPHSLHRSWFASTEDLDRASPHYMVGANMALHRRVLERVPRFEIELGAGALGFGEETFFCSMLLSAGYRLAGALDVAVEHHFARSRLANDALLDMARKRGRSDAFIYHHWSHRQSRLIMPRLALATLKRWRSRVGDRMTGVLSEESIQAEMTLAFGRELIAQRRRRRKYSLHGLVPLQDQRRPMPSRK